MQTSPHRPRPILIPAIAAASLVGALLTQSPAFAHTGHGSAGLAAGVSHPLLGPDHLMAMLAVGIVAALASSRRTAILTPMAFLLGMIGGGCLGLAGVTLPAAGVVLALSLTCLGAVCIASFRRTTPALPVAALMFGMAHGHAHGTELPMSASPVAYVIGFILASAALHILGAAIGLLLRRSPQLRIASGTLLSTTGLALLLGL